VAIKNKLLLTVMLAVVFVIGMAIYINDKENSDADSSVAQAGAGDVESADDISLDAARQAFWQRDMEGAEKLYRKITMSDVDNINAWGELGNIYFMQSKWKEAAQAYAEVTLKLLDANDFPRAAYMHNMVNRLDPEQAGRINERLRMIQMSR